MITQPLDNIQYIHVDELIPNKYNPNKVAPPEFQLLYESISNDGWLFPVIVLDKSIHIEGLTDNENFSKFTVIDGFHRYKLTKAKSDIGELTDNKIPCIVLIPDNPIATTVRLNRAKGTHGVLPMVEIVKLEIQRGATVEYIMKAYGMEEEEVSRLSLRGGIPQSDLIQKHEFSKSWIPADNEKEVK